MSYTHRLKRSGLILSNGDHDCSSDTSELGERGMRLAVRGSMAPAPINGDKAIGR